MTCRALQNDRISALADAIIQPMIYFDPVWHSKQLLLQKLFWKISINFTDISHSLCISVYCSPQQSLSSWWIAGLCGARNAWSRRVSIPWRAINSTTIGSHTFFLTKLVSDSIKILIEQLASQRLCAHHPRRSPQYKRLLHTSSGNITVRIQLSWSKHNFLSVRWLY